MEPQFRVWWDEENQVARNDWKPGSVCNLEQAKEITLATSRLGHGDVPVLVDMRHVLKADRPARQHFTGVDGRAIAVALLVGSPVSKVIADVMVGLQRRVPTRIFTEEPAALAWLKTHLA